MSKEKYIEYLLKKYDDKGAEAYEEYNRRMEERTVNEAGEVSTRETIELNNWIEEREQSIKHWFIEELKEVMKNGR